MFLFELLLPPSGALSHLAEILHVMWNSYSVSGGILNCGSACFCRVLLKRASEEGHYLKSRSSHCAHFCQLNAIPIAWPYAKRSPTLCSTKAVLFSCSWMVRRMGASWFKSGSFSKHCPCARANGNADWWCTRDTGGSHLYVFPAAVSSCGSSHCKLLYFLLLLWKVLGGKSLSRKEI